MFNFNTLTIAQLGELLKSGAKVAVTCKKSVEDLEGYAEANMRADLVAAQDDDDVRRITFDFTRFDEYNKQFETANYFDTNQKPTLTAREKGVYKPRETYYMMHDTMALEFFEPLDAIQLEMMAEYTKSASAGQSYVSWLENIVLGFRGQREK